MLTLTHTPHNARDTLYFHSTPTPVPIFQREWEWKQLLQLYVQRQPKRVLEIGTFHGGTLYHWLQNAAPDAVIVSVDIYNAGVDNRHLYGDWQKPDTQLHVISANSTSPRTAERIRAYGPFDWIFIDADHYEASVQADWNNYRPLAAPGAVIALHDILTHPNHPEIEVERVWRRIQQQGYVTQEIVSDPAADWGGIGVVYL